MATRNINSFIQHLMNEAMTTSAAGGGTKAGKGAGKTSTRSAKAGPPTDMAPLPFPTEYPGETIPHDPRPFPVIRPGSGSVTPGHDPDSGQPIPSFRPKPSPRDQSDKDGRTIPFFDVRIPGQRSGDANRSDTDDLIDRLMRRYDDKPGVPGEDTPGMPVAFPRNPGPPIDADDIPPIGIPTGGRFERLFGRYGRLYKPFGGVYPHARRK